MAKHLFVEARDGKLVPGDPWSAEVIDGLEQGKSFRVDFKTDRTLGSLRKWWAGLAYLIERWEGQGNPLATKYPTSRKLNEAILIFLGYTEVIHQLGGGALVRADSIRFEAMDEAEFTGMMEKARLMALEYFGIDPWREWVEAQQRAKEMGVAYSHRSRFDD